MIWGPGLGATSSINLPKGQTEVKFPINANGNAEVKEWKLFALGSSQGMWGSSELTRLDIAEPFATIEAQRGACEQGQTTQILCKVTQTTPFEGKATAQLIGLPNKATADPIELDASTEELIFQVKTDPETPVGKHGLYCQLQVTVNGEVVTSNAGGVELQVDKPLPQETTPPVPQPVAQAEPEKKPENKPVEKPLSRLEKLRLAAQQRKQSTAAESESP